MSDLILVVEDDTAIADMVSHALERNGFRSMHAGDVSEAERILSTECPSLMLLDWMLPGISGIELARRLGQDEQGARVPIIMLTARSEEADKVKGFDAGIDDFVVKPFSVRELIARIRAVLRRSRGIEAQATLEVDALRLDPIGHRVTVADRTVKMGPKEFRMLQVFMSHPDRVFTREQLLDQVWGSNVFIEERTVDVHVRRLRKALFEHGFEHLVQTVHGVGYRFSREP